jgi:integrase/recombinase XerC
MPCHHNLEAYLTAYLEGAALATEPQSPLFRTIGRKTKLLTRAPLARQWRKSTVVGEKARS